MKLLKLAGSLHTAWDPCVFASEKLGFQPDRHQARVLNPTIRRIFAGDWTQCGRRRVSTPIGQRCQLLPVLENRRQSQSQWLESARAWRERAL